jgi:hypothetical protein
MSRGISVGIATGCGLGFDSRQGHEIFLYSTASRPALGPTCSPLKLVPGDLSPGLKQTGREADYSPPSSGDVKNGGVIPPLHLESSWHYVLLIKHRDSFSSLLLPPACAQIFCSLSVFFP